MHICVFHMEACQSINRDMNTLSSVVKWIKKDHGGALIRSKVVLLAFAATIYTVWIAQNNFLFAGKLLLLLGLFVFLSCWANYVWD